MTSTRPQGDSAVRGDRQALPRLLRVELVLAGLSTALAVLTLVWRDWIEEVFHVDPDGGNGSLEWLIVAALATSSLILVTHSAHEFRVWRRRVQPGSASTAVL